jgi:hypothetical protein
MPIKNLRDGVLRIQDANGEEITVLYSDGDLKWSITDNVQQIYDRGTLLELRKGTEEPITGSFSRKFDQIIAKNNDAAPSVYEAVKGKGSAAYWVSTTNYCGIYTCRLIFELLDECSAQIERVTFNNCHFGKIDFEEGEDANRQMFEFLDFETEPTVEWI